MTASFRYLLPVLLALYISPGTEAAGLDDPSGDSLPPNASGDVSASMSPAREAALRSTLEKRRAKRARDRAAYQRSIARANALMASRGRPGPPSPGMYSRPPMYASNASTLDPQMAGGPGYGPAFYQAAGPLGAGGTVSAGGMGGCQRR